MSTEFTAFCGPIGREILSQYDRTKLVEQQTAELPAAFVDAMTVRQDVFVEEQKVPLENELDDDDARAFHWVVYASVGNAAGDPRRRGSDDDGDPDIERRASESTASKVAIGTIRLVPPPHEPHKPQPMKEEDKMPGDEWSDMTKNFVEPEEPYVKLGRLATLKPYRGLGISRLLINQALSWARDHANDILPSMSPAELEKTRLEGSKEQKPWTGLVLVHAQTDVETLWQKHGFTTDERMGKWDEEGIEHIGMWRRVEVNENANKNPFQH